MAEDAPPAREPSPLPPSEASEGNWASDVDALIEGPNYVPESYSDTASTSTTATTTTTTTTTTTSGDVSPTVPAVCPTTTTATTTSTTTVSDSVGASQSLGVDPPSVPSDGSNVSDVTGSKKRRLSVSNSNSNFKLNVSSQRAVVTVNVAIANFDDYKQNLNF